MRALIVEDGYSRGALAAVRSLGRGGWHVGVASPARGLAARSRWATSWHRVDRLQKSQDGFVGAVAAASSSYDVVFPCGDPEVLALSAARAELRAAFPYPPHGTVLRALDKVELAAAARNVGLRVPETGPTGFPAVVKPRLRPVGADPAAVAPAVVADEAALAERIDALAAAGVEPVVQEYVEGRLAAFVVLVDQLHRPVAECYQVAEAIWPRGAGGSVRARTAVPDPGLRSGALALLDELGWFGLAQVQFVLPPAGPPVLIDLNARFYGSLALAVAAGADFPRLWAELAAGADPGPVSARAGVRYHAFDGDLLRTGWRGAPRAARYAAGAAHSIADPHDPAPGLLQARRLAARALRVLSGARPARGRTRRVRGPESS